MAKRFTDTGKWEDSWFRNLPCEHQLFWVYLLDRCDNAGVWKVDFELAEFFLKRPVKATEMLKVFSDRIVPINDGNYWFIPKFISFQYGKLDESCHPHKSIIKTLSAYKIEGYLEGINTPKTRQDNIKTIQASIARKPVDNFKTPKYCHDCGSYFNGDKKFEDHIRKCRANKKVTV